MGLQRYAAAVLVGTTSVLALAGCGSDQEAEDPSSAPPSVSTGSTVTASPSAYPTFAPTDYSYRLSVLCRCPLVGPVDVTVEGGQVTDATVASGAAKGEPAPAYARKTINDIIALANDPAAGRNATVIWPSGAAAPRRVTVNPLRRTTDAEITYVISRVDAG